MSSAFALWKRVRQWPIGVVATVASALVLGAACTTSTLAGASIPLPEMASPATAAPTRDASTDGLSEPEAIAAARRNLADDSAPVWATMSGTFEDVFRSFEHSPGNIEEPLPDNVAADRLVWGVQFKVRVEICGPSGGVCETRDGLVTTIVDRATGEWLSTSTYAPKPGEPLPTR